MHANTQEEREASRIIEHNGSEICPLISASRASSLFRKIALRYLKASDGDLRGCDRSFRRAALDRARKEVLATHRQGYHSPP
jgi:hypothetical protein